MYEIYNKKVKLGYISFKIASVDGFFWSKLLAQNGRDMVKTVISDFLLSFLTWQSSAFKNTHECKHKLTRRFDGRFEGDFHVVRVPPSHGQSMG